MRKWLGFLLAILPLKAAEECTVMTWNIHHGQGGDGKLDLARIARVITTAAADVVLLQEVDNKCARSGTVDQMAELARLTKMHAVFGKALDLGSGEYGLGLLSRTPLSDVKIHRLPGPGEPRIALEAVTEIAGKKLRIVSTHLEYATAQARLKQAETIHELLKNRTGPVVLGGDFNDVRASATLQVFAAPWTNVEKNGSPATSPADHPKQEIDFLMVRDWEVSTACEVIPEAVASDHRPVVARVKLVRSTQPSLTR